VQHRAHRVLASSAGVTTADDAGDDRDSEHTDWALGTVAGGTIDRSASLRR
jgi:hypothetical protein